MQMQKTQRIIISINTSRACERQFVCGIARYAELHGPWAFYRKPRYYIKAGSQAMTLKQLKDWQPDGIIVSDSEKLNEIVKLKIPTIIHSIENDKHSLPTVLGDCSKSGKMAAEHLLERGFKNFAFCGVGGFYWSSNRFESFSSRISQAGFETSFYKQTPSRMQKSFEKEQKLLIDWLKSLTKPVGIMACADDCAQHIAEACEIAEIRIPEEIAVIGVDNDEMVCQFSTPPLSSIAMNFERAGFEAAELLDKIMAGKKPTYKNITVDATHVITRQSTDVLAIEDPDVVEAVRFIRQNSKQPIQTCDVLNEVGCSRRNLHRKFKLVLGRSVSDEIKRVRIEQITSMLLNSNLSIAQIAYKLGYCSPDHIARYFRDEKKVSPLAFRKQHGTSDHYLP
jgi:LacI family transcriptional regulator